MATNVQYLPWDNSTLANFKSWAQGIGTALTAFGWTKSVVPNGTVNWSTIAYTPWTGNGGASQQTLPAGVLGTLNFANIWGNNATLISITSVANASGGTSVYTGTITGGGSNGFAGTRFIIAGFGNANNNGTFLCTASTTTTLTLNNPNGVAQAATATATITYAVGDYVTNNNATWYCVTAYTPTISSPAPPFEWIALSTQHWALYAFEVWQSGGAKPIFLRFAYSGAGPGGSTTNDTVTPRINIQVGTTVDSSGNLGTGTGNTTAGADLQQVANPTPLWNPGFRLPCYFSGDSTNRFSMLMWPELGSQAGVLGSGFFCIERSLDNTGNYYSTQSGTAFVQGQSDTYANHTNTISKTFALNTTAGNAIVVFASNVGTSAAGIAISDSQSNSYTQLSAADLTVNALAQKAWVATGIAGGATTVTVTWTTPAATAQNSALAIAEYTGVTTVDQISTIKTAAGAPPWSTNSITTTQAWELLITVAITGGGSTTITSNGTTRQTTNNPTIFGIIADNIVPTTGTFSSSGGGNGNYAASLFSLKSSPNAAPVTPYWTMIWWGNNGGAAGGGFIGSFLQVGPNTWIQTQFDSRIWTAAISGGHSNPPDNINTLTGAGNGNQSIPAFPIWPLVGWVGNPMTAAMSTKFQDAPAAGSFTIPLYGTTHTFLNIRDSVYGGFGNTSGGNVNGLAMRFD